MDEYREYIKWLAKILYKKELESLGNDDANCVFYDEIDYKLFKKDIIFIIDCNSIKDTICKIYKYRKSIEEKFQIMDISLFKGNDTENYSETYLVSIYCVDKSKYNDNKEKYDTVFKNDLEHMLVIEKKINHIFEQIIEKNIEMNNIPHEDNNYGINELYNQILDCIIKKDENIIKNLQGNRKNKNDRIEGNVRKCAKIVDNKFLDNIEVEYIDQVLRAKGNKIIKGYRKLRGMFKVKAQKTIFERVHNDDFTSIVIIDCSNDKCNNKYAKIFCKIKSKVIVISNQKKLYSDKVIVISSLKKALRYVKGFKVIYVNDSDKVISDSNVYSISLKDVCTNFFSIRNVLKKMVENKECLYAFSNLDNINSIKVMTGTFFNFNGENFCSGGAERYLIDLYDVCKSLGMKLRVYQKSNFDFFRYYNDIEVVGISNNNEEYNYDYKQDKGILNRFNDIAANKTKLNIYSSFTECYGKAVSPSIGISHGVAWDHRKNVYSGDLNDKNWIIEAAMSCDKLVSVDTNTANYFQTIDYKLGNSTEVIPNYVDLNEFSYKENMKNDDRFIIVFPRRLYEARGLYLLLDIVDDLISLNKNIEIHFVGKGSKKDTDKIKEKIDKWGDKFIKLYNCPPEKMYTVYKKADISVIPTLYSEGTSLSCLEAMSSGNAVIATRVGGLTDLIINNYNGKLIEPNKESLYNAIADFMQNRELMEKCRKNAREVAKVFNKDIWIEKWKNIIKANSKKLDSQNNVYYKSVMIFVSDKNIESEKLKRIIFRNLIDRKVVYVVNNNLDRKESYGRLQYIKENEDLYRKPDIVLIDKDYITTNNIEGEYINL